MKTKVMLLTVIACMMLSSCNSSITIKTEDSNSMFVEVETGENWKIVYHEDTKVMYVVSDSGYNRGTFTLLVDADGKPMIYEGED